MICLSGTRTFFIFFSKDIGNKGTIKFIGGFKSYSQSKSKEVNDNAKKVDENILIWFCSVLWINIKEVLPNECIFLFNNDIDKVGIS